MRQTFGVDDLFAGFSDVLHKIRHRKAHKGRVLEFLEIRTAEPLVEIQALPCDLHGVGRCTIIFERQQFARERIIGDIKYPVKMQSLFLGRPFPDTHILPSAAFRKGAQTGTEPFFETFFGMFFAVISESKDINLWTLSK